MNTKNDPTLTVNLLADQAEVFSELVEKNAKTLNDGEITCYLNSAIRRSIQKIKLELKPDELTIRELKNVE